MVVWPNGYKCAWMVRWLDMRGYLDKRRDGWMVAVDCLVDGYMAGDLDNVCRVYLCFSKWPIFPLGIPQCHIYTFPIYSNALLDGLYSREAAFLRAEQALATRLRRPRRVLR